MAVLYFLLSIQLVEFEQVITSASQQTMKMVHLQPVMLKCIFQTSYLLCFFSELQLVFKYHFLKSSDNRIRLDIHDIFPNSRERGSTIFLHLYARNALVSPQAASPPGVRSKQLEIMISCLSDKDT